MKVQELNQVISHIMEVHPDVRSAHIHSLKESSILIMIGKEGHLIYPEHYRDWTEMDDAIEVLAGGDQRDA